ncbi:ECF RNA polymerase sigma factor SigW [Enhygromyxa salina]|uniref:ECF RNA polymerase sigma factor SigW n=1 Tax=Enhygromyxa salina TaxID=215803 RepID=A0A2S9XFB1_9BACT|nr:sigma-70 family RNA polymerase sigma factor [Enhygromyxa salina]PRP91553.1 ECF RNA polymerase sigma factor SigW [Enhygromyxa salina]
MNRALTQTWGRRAGRELRITDLDDPELVERAGKGGDNAAFAELVRRHQGKVRGLLLRLTGNSTLADDLGQEAFLRAYRGLVSFEGRSRFSTWIYRIAYNVFLNHRARNRELVALPPGFESCAAAPTDELSPIRFDMRRDLAGAIVALPERYRAVVTLYYLQDVSYPEIAEILDLPLGTVKTHLHRAKKMLREHLRAQGAGQAAGDPSS